MRIQFLVKLTYLPKSSDSNERHLKCVFWNKTSSKWSTNGCQSSPLESYFIHATGFYRKVCYCSHLTNFALFFDPDNSMNSTPYSNILSILTYIGVSISLICYLTMIMSRLGGCCFRHGTAQKNLSPSKTLRSLYLINSVCLFVSNISFVLILVLKPNLNLLACKLNASALQFFLIFSFSFSLGIAYQHFSKLVKVFNDSEHLFIFKLVLFSLSYAAFFTVYEFILELDGDYTFAEICWLRAPHLYYFFIAPINALLLVSLTLYVIVVIKVLSIYKKDDSSTRTPGSETPYNHRRVIVLLFFSFISLNLTWLIGMFIVAASYMDEHLAFVLEFLFCLFNSFHGLSLLVGQYLAHKYSRSGTYSNSSFTKTIVTNTNRGNSQKLLSKTPTNSSSGEYMRSMSVSSSKLECKQKSESPAQKSQASILFSGVVFAFSALSKLCSKKRKRNATQQPNFNRMMNNSLKRAPFLEFTLVNYEMDSDSNQNFQTIHTNLPNFEINLCNSNTNGIDNSKRMGKDMFAGYYDSPFQESNALNNPKKSSLTSDIGQDAYSSSV